MAATAERESRRGGRLGLIPRPAVAVIAVLVIAVWAVTQAAQVFVADYTPPPEIHLAVMLVLTALFTVRKPDDKKPNGEPPPPAEPTAEPRPGEIAAADLIARLQAERPPRPPERQ